jgi:predicted HTH transcriptional regulator
MNYNSDDFFTLKLDKNEKKILNFLAENGSINRSELMDFLKVSKSTAFRMLDKLIKKDILTQIGESRSTIYKLKESDRYN